MYSYKIPDKNYFINMIAYIRHFYVELLDTRQVQIRIWKMSWNTYVLFEMIVVANILQLYLIYFIFNHFFSISGIRIYKY